MKISRFDIYRYSLPLRRPLTSDASVTHRDGLIIELHDDNDRIAFGECAPLPGYSRESLDDVSTQMKRVAFGLRGASAPDNLEELSGGFNRWLASYDAAASVRFAVEAAVLTLLARDANKTVAALLCDSPAETVKVNALIGGEDDLTDELRESGYDAYKVKVGRDDVKEDIALVQKVREMIGDEAKLRCDANRKWGVQQAIDFWMACESLDIEYIEEPVEDHNALAREMTKIGLPSLINMMLPPTALDESLVEMSPADFVAPPGVKAVILKPTMLGLERAMMFARKAAAEKIKPIVTSTFESSVGLSFLAEFAACVSSGEDAVGLSTLDFFEYDLCEPSLAVTNGRVVLKSIPRIEQSLNRDLLTAVE